MKVMTDSFRNDIVAVFDYLNFQNSTFFRIKIFRKAIRSVINDHLDNDITFSLLLKYCYYNAILMII